MNIKNLKDKYEDIYQEGIVGLIKATNTYDSRFNLQFSTYAYKCIKNEILYYFRKNNKEHISLDQEVADDICMIDLIQDNRKLTEDLIEELEMKKSMYLILNNYFRDLEKNIIFKSYGLNCNVLTQN